MFDKDDVTGNLFFTACAIQSFMISTAIIMFSALPWLLSLTTIAIMTFFMSIIGYLVHWLSCIIQPLNGPAVISSDNSKHIPVPTTTWVGDRHQATYNGFSDLRLHYVHWMFVAPVMNAWILLKLVAFFRAGVI